MYMKVVIMQGAYQIFSILLMSLFSITGSIVVVDHILNFCPRVIICEQIKGILNGFVELLHKLVVGSERFRVVC